MDLQRRGVILSLVLLASCQLIEDTGLCEFERMFPTQSFVSLSTDKDSPMPLCSRDTPNENCTCNINTLTNESRFCYCTDTSTREWQCYWPLDDCYQLQQHGIIVSGIYTIQTLDYLTINVSCDMTTDGGGWTVFQRRVNGSVQFDRGWNDYQGGFGSLNFEFWLGNDNVHRLTRNKRYILRIDMTTMSGETLYATYDNFTVGGEDQKYQLVSLGEYSGSPGLVDAMYCHQTMHFTTKDNDNDRSGWRNCATVTCSGWWFNGGSEGLRCPKNYCKHSNLNGVYGTSTADYKITWDSKNDFAFTEMKIRPYPAHMHK